MSDPTTNAEKEIAGILARLETETGQIVESMEILVTDVTTLRDERVQWLRRVAITLKPIPGSRWQQ